MEARTTRERIADRLREEAATPADLSVTFEISRSAAVSHVRHIAKSIEGTGEQFLVRPPACGDCGFDAFDDPINRPSRCPECKSESITEPAFKISDAE
jgi:hypothetical protein